MKLKKTVRIHYAGLAFLLPVLGMIIVMLISQYAPFGKYSILYSDMYHQYFPFFKAYRQQLLSGDGFLYTWSVGMGMDYLGLISYYLASPLNLISLLVPERWLLGFFSLLMPIKLGFAGLFFAIFLKKLFHRDDLSVTLFGCCYALCAWALGYQWNIMWLDTFALLPLVVLGMVSLLRERKFALYTFTLFLSVFTNYYIGFFTCIFLLLLFICYEICRFQGFRRFFADLALMAVFSALAIGMTAVLELPALAALQATQSSVNQFPQGFRLNIADENTWKGLLDAMRQVAGNCNSGVSLTFKEGLPNLYCGALTNILAILYLTCRQVKLRDKLCSVFLLLFLNVSFIIRQLDYIWHGFHFTNMIPYRFSFLYSFILLYMAYRAYTLRHTFHLPQVVVSCLLGLGLILCSQERTKLLFWLYNGLLLLLCVAALVCGSWRSGYPSDGSREDRQQFFRQRQLRRQMCTWMLLGTVAVDLILTLLHFGLAFTGSNISNYPKGGASAASAVRYMKEREENRYELFFRAETAHSQTLNDGALNGYSGISAFTSSANVKVTEFMKALGYGAKNTYNRYCHEESSPISNLFLGLKYMLTRDGQPIENAYFDQIYSFDNVTLMENNAYLPLGFLTDARLQEVDFSQTGNRFQFQNSLLNAASGLELSYWTQIPGQCLTVTGNDAVDIQLHTLSGYCSYQISDTENGVLTYQYHIEDNGFFCFDIDQSKRNSICVCKNGLELYSETYSLPQMLAVGDVAPGDEIEIRLGCAKGESGRVDISAALLDETQFRQAYRVLAASPLKLEVFRNTRLSGTVQCDRDGILYTSIPQNGNWHMKVDGKEIQPVLIGGVMIGIPLTEGAHTIRFYYYNSAFTTGAAISISCGIIFLILCKHYYFPRKKDR